MTTYYIILYLYLLNIDINGAKNNLTDSAINKLQNFLVADIETGMEKINKQNQQGIQQHVEKDTLDKINIMTKNTLNKIKEASYNKSEQTLQEEGQLKEQLTELEQLTGSQATQSDVINFSKLMKEMKIETTAPINTIKDISQFFSTLSWDELLMISLQIITKHNNNKE